MVKEIIFIALNFCAFSVISQEKKIIPASPEAAGLAKFLNYPVNYSTGLPDISIPLLEINSGDISLPITLSYHAGGIKLNEKSTWVGLGWQLSAEPEITRVINSYPDEGGYLHNNFGEFTAHNLDYLKSMAYGQSDEEPDMFFYKLAKSSGKYFYHGYSDRSYKAFTVPYTPIDISNGNKSIIDVDGTLYRFGTSLTGVEAYEVNNQVDNFVTTWKCTEIISPSKQDTMSFKFISEFNGAEYEIHERYEVFDKSFSTFAQLFQPVHYFRSSSSGGPPFDVNPRLNNINNNLSSFGTFSIIRNDLGDISYSRGPNANLYTEAEFMVTKKTIKIDEIKYRSGRVQFFKHYNSNRLDSIQVFDHLGKKLKSICFYLSPWNPSPPRGVPSDRTRLDSIVVKDGLGKGVEHYSFEYNLGDNLDYGTVKRSDPWGYYIGDSNPYDSGSSVHKQNVEIVESLSSIRPGNTYNISIGSDNVSNTLYTQPFMLRKIYYPTGGHTQFDYEKNQYRDSGVVKNAGGLRIKSIKFFKDKSDIVSLEKNYKYGESEDGAGFIKLNYNNPSNYMYEQKFIYIQPYYYGSDGRLYRALAGEYVSERKRTYLSNPISNVSFTNGAPAVYSSVSEYQKDNGLLSGKTIYKYDYDAASAETDLNYEARIRVQKDEWPRGALLSETNYSFDNGKYTWIRKKETGYKNYYKETFYVGKVFARNLVIKDVYAQNTDQYENIAYVNYNLSSGCKLPILENEFIRDLKDTTRILNTSLAYYYDNALSIFPTRKVSVNSVGDAVTTYTTHPNDYPNTDPALGTLKNSNMLTLEIEKVTTLKKQGDVNPVIIEGFLSKYSNLGLKLSDSKIESPAPYSLSNFKFSNAPVGVLPDATGQYNYEPSPLYKVKNEYSYDEKGNLAQAITNGILKTTYIWSYKNLYPVAEVKNSTAVESVFLGFEESDPRYYNSGGISFSTSRTGKACYNLSQGPIKKGGLQNTRLYLVSYWTLNNAPYTISGTIGSPVLSKTSNSWRLYTHKVIGQLDISVSGSGYIDDFRIHPEAAEMISYTYDPSVGMTSTTDSKGFTTYFIYDAAGRLILMKDQDQNIIKQYKYHYTGSN